MTTQYDPRSDYLSNLPLRFVERDPIDDILASELQSVVSCSLCLRTFRGGAWIEAEEAIRELRSFERSAPLPLEPGLCDDCIARIRTRREA